MHAASDPEVGLIWSEGAVYSVGVELALRHWASWVRPGASVVFSEACWFVGPEQRVPELLVGFRCVHAPRTGG